MQVELLALRLIHILSGIMWVGSGIFTTFFLAPVLKSSPAVTGQVMAGLRRQRIFIVLPIVAALAILSGLRLLWIDSAGFASSYFVTGTGKTFAMSALAAVVAYVLAYGVALPAVLRAGVIGSSLAASPQSADHAQLAVELDRLRRRGTIATTLAVAFGILAASGMAIARYV
jgi:uncharacterized membrane protein